MDKYKLHLFFPLSVFPTFISTPVLCSQSLNPLSSPFRCTGADGSHFDFTGNPNSTYCLVSDAHLHVNAYYGGRFASDSQDAASKAMTWIRKVGILWGHHTIQLAAREGARWQYDNGYMASIEVDGKLVALTRPGETVWFPVISDKNRVAKKDGAGNRIGITWVAAQEKSGDDLVDVYDVQVSICPPPPL